MKVKTAKEICAAIAQNNKFYLGNKKEITFGFTKLDTLICNTYLEKGNVICLSAKPGIGK